MLINLSNHPKSTWSPEQLKAAQQQFGMVVDMAFPNVKASWSTEQVAVLALKYVDEIAALQPKAVHVMGEMTLTYQLVKLLTKVGIPCYASTSERLVSYDEQGNKIVRFAFEQFRAYE